MYGGNCYLCACLSVGIIMVEAIKVEGLSYSYSDGTAALEDVDLTIIEGEKVVIVGPNGAGKTTFFLHLNGTIKNPTGNVSVFGKSISDMRIEERVPHNLSNGQKKRVALASVLSMESKVLVLDEPTANLDPRSCADFISLINDLNKRDGITTIIAMYDVNALPELADRVYVLNRRIVAEGPPREIFSDWELLKTNNLEALDVFKLFKVLKCFGYSSDDLPLSFDEAVEVLTKTMGGREGYVHLHIHEHTHKEISNLMQSYNHHRQKKAD